MSKKIARLWIPEKPSVAKELSQSICRVFSTTITNQKTQAKDGFTRFANGDVVCSVFGHMIQMQPPFRYLTKEQNNNLMDALPLIPDPFKFEPNPERNKDGTIKMKGGKPVISERFKVLEKLIKEAKTFVNACDIDREGQLIFDELLDFCGVPAQGENVQRASIVDVTADALDKTISKLEPNTAQKWKGKGQAAATRQKMDWILGMNASMAYQVVTGIRTMSVGRVQTPVLSLVVERDMIIENFQPKTYYIPVVIMTDGTRLRWDKRKGSESEAGFDESGRIIDKALAQAIVDKIQSGIAGEVLVAKQEEKRQAPPLPFAMGSLQTEASRKNGLTVEQVTKAAQNLYEKHKAITYVGTDCRYIPEEMQTEASRILKSLSTRFSTKATGANPSLKSRAFNDKKISEHFAILPTGTVPNFSTNESAEKAVYETICNRYMAQFYPDYRYVSASLVVGFGDDEFRASARKDVDAGWKVVEDEGDENSGDDGQSDTDDHKEAPSRKQSQK